MAQGCCPQRTVRNRSSHYSPWLPWIIGGDALFGLRPTADGEGLTRGQLLRLFRLVVDRDVEVDVRAFDAGDRDRQAAQDTGMCPSQVDSAVSTPPLGLPTLAQLPLPLLQIIAPKP